MRKSEYRKPELDVVVMHDNLLDTLPKNSTTYDDDEILAKPNDFDFDDIEEGGEGELTFDSLWD